MNWLILPALLMSPGEAAPSQHVIVVVGAAGTEEYGQRFAAWSDRWQQAAEQSAATFKRIGPGANTQAETPDRQLIKEAIRDASPESVETLWLVLLGHGTFDGRQAKFNLRGPDVSAAQLGEWLAAREGPTVVINCASSSAPFINQLSAADRVIVTATKSGYQYQYAHFGEFLSAAVADQQIDLDKDEQTSLLEAFLAASHGVKQFYDEEARLATEHALLEDNGDGLGTSADWFQGIRAVRTAKQGARADGFRANQLFLVPRGQAASIPLADRRRRDELEVEIEQLRARKDELSEEEYYGRLEEVLVQLARLYHPLEHLPSGRPPAPQPLKANALIQGVPPEPS